MKAILFDLDDTIINFTEAGEACWWEMCLRYEHQVDGYDAGQLYTAIRQTAEWFWNDPERIGQQKLDIFSARREVVGLALEKLGASDTGVAEEIADAYSGERDEGVGVFPGAIETLLHFRTARRKLALVTNGGSEMQRAKIEKFKLENFFHHIQIEGEYGRGKPEKQVFLNTLKALEVSAVDTWMVGDDLLRDVAGAQSAGIYGIWLDWKGTGLPEDTQVKPDRIIRNISELV